MRTSNFVAVISALALALAGCGGGGSDDSKFTDPGTTPGTGGNNPPPASSAAAITATTSAASIPSDGSASATITAMVRDANNNLVQNVPVTFTATSGGVAVTQPMTDQTGAAKATLTTAGDSSLRSITVTVSAGSLSSTVNVQVVAGGSTSNSVQMGMGTGGSFQPGMIAVQTTSLSAGGSTSLQVVLQKSDGTLYTQPATITFSSPCAAQGLSSVGQPVTTSTGIASATYTASGCSGSDVITATSTVGSASLSATGTVTVAASTIGSIVFESATPSNIALKGTGDTARPESSTLVFRVLDATGGPRSGATVTFTPNTTVGGLSIGPLTAQSGTDGRVSTVVNAGTVATSVRVTAAITSVTPNIATQSSQLTVTTGIPDQDSFSLAVKCTNVEALHIDGVQVPVTARLADRFNNPVPDGTAVTLTTAGGNIIPQCLTTTITGANAESGVCTVNWTSANPRPANGRVALLATAIGEESFNDANGNGTFDNGETFTDISEPYLDVNNNGAYDAGEPIYDFNNNSTRDGPDSLFNGVLCSDTTGRCDATKKTTGIGARNVIVMSDSVPLSEPADGSTLAPTIATTGTQTYFITIKDVNDNPMPALTKIEPSVVGTGLALSPSTGQVTIPCTPTKTQYPFTIVSTAASATGDGTLSLKVTTPGGIITTLSFKIDVN
jgi:hypothetical protein